MVHFEVIGDKTWSPIDYDFVQGIWRNVAFTAPLLRSVAHPSTHGFRIRRSHGTAVDEVLHTINTKAGVILQTDVSDCFHTLAFQHLRGKILRGRLEIYILRIHERYRQAVRYRGPIGQGLPAGHPCSPALAVMSIDELLRPIREEWHEVAVIVFADDITIIGPDVKWAGKVFLAIEGVLRRHGMELNPAKTRYTDPAKGGSIELLGYEIDWARGPSSPTVRPKIRAFTRLTEKVAEAPDSPTIRRIVEGWQNAYDRNNDPETDARMKEAVRLGKLLRANR